MTLTTEIQQLIEKQLPAMHADQLAKFIKDANDTEKKLEEADKYNKSLAEKINELELERGRLRSLQLRSEELDKREGSLNQRDIALQLKELKHQIIVDNSNLKVIEAEKRADSVYNLVGILFQNERISQSIMENRSRFVPSHSTGGQWSDSYTESDNYSYTKVEQKYKDTPSVPGEKKVI